MLTLWNILVQIFLVLNTTEINTNRRADSQLLGLHGTPLKSRRESVMPGHAWELGWERAVVWKDCWALPLVTQVTLARSPSLSEYQISHLRHLRG